MIIIPYILFVAQKDDFVTSNVKFFLTLTQFFLKNHNILLQSNI